MLQWHIQAAKVTRIVETDFPVPRHPQHPVLPDATPDALQAAPQLYADFAASDGRLKWSTPALPVETRGLRPSPVIRLSLHSGSPEIIGMTNVAKAARQPNMAT